MAIYTRTGDRGETSLFGGKRISKSSIQVEAYGSVDELSSSLGLVIAKLPKKEKIFLTEIQKDLYKIMAHLSGSKLDLSFLDLRVKNFEKKIDGVEKKLPRLTRFILPGGTELSSWFHILRTVCRRSERSVVKYFEKLTTDNRPALPAGRQLMTIKYLNRLSDLFFTLARWYGRQKETLL